MILMNIETVFLQRQHINILMSGQKYLTFNTTLAKIPGSRLAKLAPTDSEYDATLGAYVYERNATIFPYILSTYTTGTLHLPHDLCASAVKDEIDFWQIPEELLPTCCWRRYK